MFSPGLEISHQWKFCHHQTGQFLASANYKSQRVPKFCFLAELCKKSFMFPKKSRWQFSRFYLHNEFRQNLYQQSTDALALPLVTRLVDNAGLTLQFLRYESPPAPKSQGEGGALGMFKLNRPLLRLGLGYLSQGSRPQFPAIVIYLQKHLTHAMFCL